MTTDPTVRAAAESPVLHPPTEAPRGGWLRLRRKKEASVPATTSDGSERQWLFSGADEVFRSIYTRYGIDVPQTLGVCSALQGEGKTTVALGLAATVAQDFGERRVLLVETDFREPRLAQDFDIDPSPGLAECLEMDHPFPLACRPTHLENLQILPAGVATTSGSRMLRSGKFAATIGLMRATYDLVILDIPAILAQSDSLMLSDLADGILFVVRAGSTPSNLVDQALAEVNSEKLRGVVLNEASSSVPGWIRRLLGV